MTKTYEVEEPEVGNDLIAALRRPKNEAVQRAAAYDAAVEIEALREEIARLRSLLTKTGQKAASENERLSALWVAETRENERLRAALERIADDCNPMFTFAVDIAREALK
jgi:hypothetical protein